MRIEVLGTPVGKGRPRATRANGFLSFYTPAKTRAWEKAISTQAAIVMGSQKPLEGPLRVLVKFWLPVPKSWPKKRREAPGKHQTKPDLDNLLKCVLDACNGIVFKDDVQVYKISCEKYYVDWSGIPGVSIFVEEE